MPVGLGCIGTDRRNGMTASPHRWTLVRSTSRGPPVSDPSVSPEPPDRQAGSFEPSFHDQEHAPKPLRSRRIADRSTVSTLLLRSPGAFWSLAVVNIFLDLFLDGPWVTIFTIGWIFSGTLAFIPQFEVVIARVLLRLRVPTDQELQRLDASWKSVLQAAGVGRHRYQLWVDDRDNVNASASGGHIVAVTRRALTSLPPRHLEAILAHELAHHLNGHSWAIIVTRWYEFPARCFLAVLQVLTVTVLRILYAFSGCGFLIGLFIAVAIPLSWFWMGVSRGSLFLQIIMLGPIVAPVLSAWVDRQAEFVADSHAAELGYGPDLIEVFDRELDESSGTEAEEGGWLSRLFSTHPPMAERIRAIELCMGQGPQ
ncbi:M48 family metalloprotease [Streptomyces sp. NPDC056231]|uniref:M48 family metalloprotease n=1 Tax=Streptomyces sp. NPDC056231 TaxID=3345755 RepID=UPI003AAAA697